MREFFRIIYFDDKGRLGCQEFDTAYHDPQSALDHTRSILRDGEHITYEYFYK